MSYNKSEQQVPRNKQRVPRGRNTPPRRLLTVVVALVVLVAVIVVVVLLVGQSHDEMSRAGIDPGTLTPETTSPYDLTELPLNTNLETIDDTAFVSLLIKNDDGTSTSYGISSNRPAAQALIEAIKKADDISQASVSTTTPSDTIDGDWRERSTITFVLASRDILTFAVDLEHGVISRGDQVWRPDGDLRTLVETAIAEPQ